MEAELDKQKLWKIKRVHNCWFLDAGGKLTRLTILKDASDVYLEDNIILADDLTYQLTVESDGQIVISKIEEICQKDYKNIDNNTDWLEQTQEENYELGSEEFVSIKDNKMIGGDAESDLEQENTLVLDSEVYKPKKGKIRGLFHRFKKTENKSTSEADAVDGLCCSPKMQPLVQFRELEVPRESVKLLKKLESGCFGEVYAGKWRNTVDVAVKSLENCQMTVDDFLAEAELMVHLRHNKLVQLMAVCTKTEPILIITEYMINGNLLDYLRKDGGNSLSFDSLADMAGQIADGMAYLETVDCVHRDLRAANILVGDCNEVKVTGFHLAKFIQGDFYDVSERGTKFPLKWTALEVPLDQKFSIKSDVWSFGVLLYELITFGRIPYPGMTNKEVLNRLAKGFRMQQPTEPVPCPDPYYEIMLKCWNRVAESRPTFAYLHDFFDNYMVNVE